MRTVFLMYFSVLRVASGPRVKLASCKSALTSPTPLPRPVLYSTDRSKAVPRSWSYCLLLCGLFYEAICFISYLVLFCSCVLALRLPPLGKRELILVFFIRLFDFHMFGFVCFPLGVGKSCGGLLYRPF